MAQDTARVTSIKESLRQEGLDAVVGTLPSDVLLLSGYWPVTGTAVAVVTRDGISGALAPADEQRLAERGRADILHLFEPGSLTQIETLIAAVRQPLIALRDALGLRGGRIGYRRGPSAEPSAYAASHLYETSILDLLSEVFPQAELVPADPLLARLRGVKTPQEIGCIRRACQIAEMAYGQGVQSLQTGQRETEVASQFQSSLSIAGVGYDGAVRADGFVYCMAGADSYQASGAYARSRARVLEAGDVTLIHCNSYADGYWTDITRTFSLGQPSPQTQQRFQAVLTAHQAALEAIAPGVPASAVDRAARSVLEAQGLGAAFKHATGHGVGYDAFNPNSIPRVHPVSQDILETGMVFNIEPAVYLEGWGGMRHCSMVAVTDTGAELLTPFLMGIEALMCAEK